MPYRRKKKAVQAKRGAWKPRVYQTPFPSTTKTIMRYNDTLSFQNIAGTPDIQIYRANGLFDPAVSLGGHQPRFFDQLMALYDHFVVIGVRAKFELANKAGNDSLLMGMTVQDASTTRTMNDYLESRNSVHKQIEGGGNGKGTLAMNVNPNKFLGRSHPLSDPQLKGSASSDPTEQAYIHLWVIDPSGLAMPNNVTGIINLEYTAILIEPKTPPQS